MKFKGRVVTHVLQEFSYKVETMLGLMSLAKQRVNLCILVFEEIGIQKEFKKKERKAQ